MQEAAVCLVQWCRSTRSHLGWVGARRVGAQVSGYRSREEKARTWCMGEWVGARVSWGRVKGEGGQPHSERMGAGCSTHPYMELDRGEVSTKEPDATHDAVINP